MGQLRKTLAELLGRQMAHVKINVRVMRLANPIDDRPADNIPRRQLRHLVIFGHESLAVPIEQQRSSPRTASVISARLDPAI